MDKQGACHSLKRQAVTHRILLDFGKMSRSRENNDNFATKIYIRLQGTQKANYRGQ